MSRPTPRTVANNIIKSHGVSAFNKLIDLFRSNTRGPKIAVEFGVTRQRVHQWKTSLGEEKVSYIPAREIEDLIPKPASNVPRTRTSV